MFSVLWIDYTLLGLVLLSAVISVIRGFVREALSLAVWVLAFWVGVRYSPLVSEVFLNAVTNPSLRQIAAFLILFIVTMMVGGLLSALLSQVMKLPVLRSMDRSLGVVFGLVRGGVIVAVLVLVGSYTPFREAQWWQDSLIISFVEPLLNNYLGQILEPLQSALGGAAQQ